MRGKKIVSRFAEDWSSAFVPFLSFFFPAFICLHTAFFFPPRHSIFLHYFLVGFGGIFPAMVLCLLARPYPFSPYPFDADMCHLQSVTLLGLEERKVLTFWKKSQEVKVVIWKSGTYFLVFALFLAIISILLAYFFDRRTAARLFNIPTEEISQSAKIFGLIGKSTIYFIFSFLFISWSLASFLKRNIDRIAAMDIEPWPADKPYAPAHPNFPFMNLPEQSEDSPPTYIHEILRMDPKTPFTWRGFIRLISIPIILILSWIAVGQLLGPTLKYVIAYFTR